MTTANITERFFSKVKKTRGCWNWLASGNGHGRGMFWNGKKNVQSHRVSWELHKGKIPIGMLVCHTCDNGLCVNPDHLFIGTQKDNMHDCLLKNRYHRPIKTVCIRGHNNWRKNITGKRIGIRRCVDCMRMHDKNYKQRKREALRTLQQAQDLAGQSKKENV